MRFFRVIRNPIPAREDFLADRDAGKPPPSDPAFVHTHDGFSVYDRIREARRTARKFPRLGSYIAEVHISEDSGITVEQTGFRSHYTMRGDPDAICAAVQKVHPIAGELT